jgi:hypothetical protein
MADAIEILAASFGVWGTVLLARNGPRAGRGWLAYLVSNVAWLVVAWRTEQWPLFVMHLAFLASSIFGIWVWLLKPALDALDEVFAL